MDVKKGTLNNFLENLRGCIFFLYIFVATLRMLDIEFKFPFVCFFLLYSHFKKNREKKEKGVLKLFKKSVFSPF